MHYQKWYRYGDPLASRHSQVPGGTPCSVETCTNRAYVRGYCGLHYQRFLNNGDPLIDRRAGSANTSWRGTEARYDSKHRRVYRARGKPRPCSVCGRDDDGTWYDWANLTGNYDDINDFAAMCRFCHRKYDKQGVGERNVKAVLTEVLVREIRARHAAGESVKAMLGSYGVSASSLQRAIRGETWAHVA